MKIVNKKNLAIETETLKIPALGEVTVDQKTWEKLYQTEKSVRKAVELGYIMVTNQTNSKK